MMPYSELNTSKLKEFADDNFKFHENGRKFSKRVENTVKKEKLVDTSNFSFFPQCFQKTCNVDMYNPGLVWERDNKNISD